MKCSRHWRDEKFKILIGKPEGGRPHGRSRCTWFILEWVLRSRV